MEVDRYRVACSFVVPERKDHEPCWGTVELMNEADTFDRRMWIYACQGHEPVAFGAKYAPPPEGKHNGAR